MLPHFPLSVSCLLVAVLGAVTAHAQGTARVVEVYAAGSLRAAFSEVSRAFEQDRAVKVNQPDAADGEAV